MLLAVELCSLTFQPDDTSVANMIAASLFGDGAAAAVVVHDAAGGSGPRIVATRSVLYPGTGHVMGWNISERGFHLVLSPEISDLIRDHLPSDVDGFLGDHGLQRHDIGVWMVHAGGPKILTTVDHALNLPPGALDLAWHGLEEKGNISSASVLLVLKETMESRRPAAGSYGLLFAMGPGFCSEMILVRW
ncbi:MAG: 3-oxoacyl-[acyl-carrier-protein] synthase III C-terminal domain-containing protein [Acidobacteriota bacterium]